MLKRSSAYTLRFEIQGVPIEVRTGTSVITKKKRRKRCIAEWVHKNNTPVGKLIRLFPLGTGSIYCIRSFTASQVFK
jgi:hypothetical protein